MSRESSRNQAEHAIGSVVEAECPLCKLELRVHDGRAYCSCCGDSHLLGRTCLDVKDANSTASDEYLP